MTERRPQHVVGPLPAELAQSVRTAASAAHLADGAEPLDEAALLRLEHGDAEAGHLLRWAPDNADELAGYAQVVAVPGARPDEGGATRMPPAVEVAVFVHPRHRRQGVGGSLVDEAAEEATAHPGYSVRGWAHGTTPAARGLAASRGFRPVRELLELGRRLDDLPPAPEPPAGVVIRPFRDDVDADAWVTANAAAFASHPEQGRWTRADFDLRRAEPWFDPDGLLLAERAPASDEDRHAAARPRLLGFHWTKLDPDQPPTGEVYVLGIVPEAQGLGLGTLLLLAGLQHLRDRGAVDVALFVEGDNTAARRLYERRGFEQRRVDTMYAR